ncbi:hypothetical protein ACLX1H_000217 [Fusarium chlamydosporum]
MEENSAAQDETYKPHRRGNIGAFDKQGSSSSLSHGGSFGRKTDSVELIDEDISHQDDDYLEKKVRIRARLDKRAQLDKLDEEMEEVDRRRDALFEEAELTRLSLRGISSNVALANILARYKASEMRRHEIEAERRKICDVIL